MPQSFPLTPATNPTSRSARRLAFLLIPLALQFAHADSATWNLNPTNGDWYTAANWTPNTVPNGPGDIATFDVSTITDISPAPGTGSIEVDSIVFNPGASAYTITVPWYLGEFNYFLYISGTGIVNNSGVSQNFVNLEDDGVIFENNATAGNLTVFSNPASANLDRSGGITFFLDNSNAGNGMFINGGDELAGGSTQFYDNSSAGNATIINEAAGPGDSIGGATYFFENATAGTATIINEGGAVADSGGGLTHFDNDATTADATVINNGGSVEGAQGGSSDFLGASPSNGTFIANGTFSGLGAGRIFFTDSAGGTPRIELFGTGALELGSRIQSNLTIGSIEGDGFVFLGPKALIVGSNNLNTLFSGVIGGNRGSLTKIGTSTLELTGANTYTGGTTIEAGSLVINNTTGSGTGSGVVQVNAGRLGGRGTITGPVTVGTGSGPGALLAPGRRGGKPDTLIIQNALTFNSDATYYCGLNNRSVRADEVVADGVTIKGAQFSLVGRGGLPLPEGTVLTVINNTSATPISGTFANLPDASTFTIHGNTFQISYEGGDGNDLTLTVVP